MKLPTRRECADCGERWSYADQETVTCPSCGSIRSTTVGDRRRHTDAGGDLDLTEAVAAVDERPVDQVAELAAEAVREYTNDRGFLHDGRLQPLDEAFVAASVLEAVANERRLPTAWRSADDVYFLELLEAAADGRLPDADVPDGLRSAYGRGVATAIGDYQRDLRRADGTANDPLASRIAERIRDHRNRFRALEGDVSTADADRLLAATRALGRGVVEDDEAALVQAENWLAGIERSIEDASPSDDG